MIKPISKSALRRQVEKILSYGADRTELRKELIERYGKKAVKERGTKEG